jgi:hypothetical protein
VRYLALIVLVAAMAPAHAAEPAKQATPTIVVEPDGFDFGRALVNKTLTKEFVLRNTGDAELEIRSVRTSCGCTAALPGSRKIAPGSHTSLTVTLDTRGHPGKLQRAVYVESNDPHTRVLQIQLSVEVVDPNARDTKKD